MDGNASSELLEIRRLRKKHNLTQVQLAKLAGVSQSLIAKIEAGTVDPTFSHVKRIVDALHGMERERGQNAGQLITNTIITIARNDAIADVIKKMRAGSISQLPVMDREQVVGMVSESTIIDAIADGRNPTRLQVKDIMEEAPPIVAAVTPMAAVTELLRHVPLIIVAQNGRPKGVITKADILRKIG